MLLDIPAPKPKNIILSFLDNKLSVSISLNKIGIEAALVFPYFSTLDLILFLGIFNSSAILFNKTWLAWCGIIYFISLISIFFSVKLSLINEGILFINDYQNVIDVVTF